jgi:regulator of cell morphogenesis and NO signaling
MTATPDSSVRDIVAEDFRAAAVFERFGIDYCCGGRRSLADACRAAKADPLGVLIEVNAACAQKEGTMPRFAEWGLDALTAYIVREHHRYVRQALPVLIAHTRKVAAAHGASHPELATIATVFETVADEMATHMEKEERILFPYIDALALAVRLGEPIPAPPFGSVDKPIAVMEEEHEFAGRAMDRIRDLSRDYSLPPDACSTWRVCFSELDAFERDLHVHVHLENNVLFPKARALAAQAR